MFSLLEKENLRIYNQGTSSHLSKILIKAAEKCDTPGGIARAEDPIGEVVFFTNLAEAVPPEREYFSAATIMHSSKFRVAESKSMSKLLRSLWILPKQQKLQVQYYTKLGAFGLVG